MLSNQLPDLSLSQTAILLAIQRAPDSAISGPSLMHNIPHFQNRSPLFYTALKRLLSRGLVIHPDHLYYLSDAGREALHAAQNLFSEPKKSQDSFYVPPRTDVDNYRSDSK